MSQTRELGFWFEKPAPNAAAMKAFIVNRVGDFGLALGIFTIFMLTGSVQFDTIFQSAAGLQNANFVMNCCSGLDNIDWIFYKFFRSFNFNLFIIY